VFKRGYTWWKWLLTSIPTAVLFVLLNVGTFMLLKSLFDQVKFAAAIHLVIWGVIIFPLVVLLPLGIATSDFEVSPGGKIACLVIMGICILGSIIGIGILLVPEVLSRLASRKKPTPETYPETEPHGFIHPVVTLDTPGVTASTASTNVELEVSSSKDRIESVSLGSTSEDRLGD